MSVKSKCPRCQAVNEVGEHLIGRYTTCDHCRCRFYVEVPVPEDADTAASIYEPSHLEKQVDMVSSEMSRALGQASNATQRLERQMQQVLLGLSVLGMILVVNTVLLILLLAKS